MTRKHYNKIADALYYGLDANKHYAKYELVQLITNTLKGTNPAYDSARFYNACMNGRTSRKRKAK